MCLGWERLALQGLRGQSHSSGPLPGVVLPSHWPVTCLDQQETKQAGGGVPGREVQAGDAAQRLRQGQVWTSHVALAGSMPRRAGGTSSSWSSVVDLF